MRELKDIQQLNSQYNHFLHNTDRIQTKKSIHLSPSWMENDKLQSNLSGWAHGVILLTVR